MGLDLYKRNIKYGGSFAADRAVLSLGAQDGIGLLVQNLNIQYSQMVTKFFDLRSEYIYYVGGRTTGGVGLGRILGPAKLSQAFYSTYGDLCLAGSNNMDFIMKSSICNGANTGAISVADAQDARYSCKYCVLTNIGLSLAAQDMILSESSQANFGSLEYE